MRLRILVKPMCRRQPICPLNQGDFPSAGNRVRAFRPGHVAHPSLSRRATANPGGDLQMGGFNQTTLPLAFDTPTATTPLQHSIGGKEGNYSSAPPTSDGRESIGHIAVGFDRQTFQIGLERSPVTLHVLVALRGPIHA